MEHFRGNILDNNQVLLEDVEGVLYFTALPGGWRTWEGSFAVPAYAGIEIGDGPYRLELEDGRGGEIVIMRKGAEAVAFKGTGLLEGH
ncbi:MAG TPA: hypothetical protein VMW16_05200 [Sedimentisphaerales bacterium]|nr:hypothetical protein [Sedimentisphaerales bacterium]